MAKQYPTAYRSAAQKYQGGQAFNAAQPANDNVRARALPKPANDNVRVPKPANDNVPRSSALVRSAGATRAANLLRIALSGIRFLSPALLALALAIELYRWWREQPQNEGPQRLGTATDSGSWARNATCIGTTNHYGMVVQDSVGLCLNDQGRDLPGRFVHAISAAGLAIPAAWGTTMGLWRSYDLFPGVPAGGPTKYEDADTRVGLSSEWTIKPGATDRIFTGTAHLRDQVWPEVPVELDPFSRPISQFEAPVKALPYELLPYRQPNPYRSPTEQSHRGNTHPDGRPRVEPDPELVPGTVIPLPWPGIWIVPQPGVPLPPLPPGRPPVDRTDPRFPPVGPGPDINVGPGPGPGTQGTPGHRFAPPPPRTRERKTKVSIGQSIAVRFIVNPLTEGFDLIDAIYDALPEKLRQREAMKTKAYQKFKQKTPTYRPSDQYTPGQLAWLKRESRKYQRDANYEIDWSRMPAGDTPIVKSRAPSATRKLQIIYNNYSKLDLEEAVKNLIVNQIEDYLYGRAGKQLGKTAKEFRLPHGFQSGPVL